MGKEVVSVTRADLTPDHVAIYDYTYVDKKTGEILKVWHPVVNLENGTVDCNCPDFNFRVFPRARVEKVRPDIGSCRHHCKHIEKAILDCIERHDITLVLK